MDDALDINLEGDAGAVSASWVFWVLKRRFGCVDMGWRDETAWYWVTPNGVAFTVADPAADATSTGARGGGRELGFSRAYARELIARIREMLKRQPQ